VTKIAGSVHISCYDKRYLMWLLTNPGDRAVCGHSLVGIVGSNPDRGEGGIWMSVACECCVSSGRSLCDGSITLPKESQRILVCLNVIAEP
jgi:hypothetical protein